MGNLFAGAARRLITPPLGMRTVGFSSREGLIQRIDDDLTITALVVSDETTRVAILAVDVAIIPLATMKLIRQQIADAIETTPSHVLVNVSHTHSAPNVGEWLPDDPIHADAETHYTAQLIAAAIEAAVDAGQQLQPARMAAGWGECRMNINRREVDADGRVFLGEDPSGVVDPAVGVIRFDDLDGNTIAITFSYGCHTVVVGPRSLSASPDFPGPARHLIEQACGGLSLFLQACGGNIMPVGGMGYEVDCRDANERFGRILGAEVIKVAASLRTHLRRGERRSLSSLSRISLWPWVAVEGHAVSFLDAVDESVMLEFIPLPSMETAEKLRAKWTNALADARSRGARDAELNIDARFAEWGEALVDAVQKQRRLLEMPVQAIRINDVMLVGIAAEAFAETGLHLKKIGVPLHTQVLGYSNGCVAYLPQAQHYPAGGWDVEDIYGIPDLLFQAYSLPVATKPDSEDRVVLQARRLMEQLSQEKHNHD